MACILRHIRPPATSVFESDMRRMLLSGEHDDLGREGVTIRNMTYIVDQVFVVEEWKEKIKRDRSRVPEEEVP